MACWRYRQRGARAAAAGGGGSEAGGGNGGGKGRLDFLSVNTPLLGEDGESRVTQTAVFDSDFDVFGPERSQINGLEHHRLFRRFATYAL